MRNILLPALALIALAACNIFGLRDSEPPSEEAEWNNFATTLDLALDNLRYAYEDPRNAINYGRIFLNDYVFYFAQQDITDYSTDAQWTSAQEQDMLLNLQANYKNISLHMEPMDTEDEIYPDEAKLSRSYEIKARNDNEDIESTIAQGRMELHYHRQNGYWYIYRWRDYRSSGERTWGLLKHENG
ncbi:MAG: hypothetical protein WCY87_05870 [Candidatus Cloacimonadales bacterium]|mgnify:FL=1|jgi:hypothetical protein|nr:hypothetical protein [Candidatus Cloacimonadota bacterium]MDY0381986.1 hypothetical protein [Candidatus Cloacimonadaceae bacterium]HCM15837.1 hypothetical protein [Candidatus Cloacimonas sp.]MCB5257090.1 hypothetical protein [Candidatus Cloacimonadota bacterium]MCB5264542.1 hypothetical protein [Candidatus Cloacimonadota bacterium]